MVGEWYVLDCCMMWRVGDVDLILLLCKFVMVISMFENTIIDKFHYMIVVVMYVYICIYISVSVYLFINT